MTVVVNATPLIALAMIDQLDLLHHLFGDVLVPPTVREEVVHDVSKPGAATIAAADWLKQQQPQAAPTIEPLLLALDRGEFEVLLLAHETQPDWVLLDEQLGRRNCTCAGIAG